MTPLSTVLIGGHSDGKRITLPKPEPAIRCAFSKPNLEAKFPSSTAEWEIYTLRHWAASQGKVHHLYVLEGMSDSQAMDMLLQNYPHHPDDE